MCKHGAVFREIDLLTAEHGIDPLAQAGFLRELQEEREGFVGEAILRVIQVEARRLRRHAFAALGIIREELAEMQFADFLMVSGEGLPCPTFSEGRDWCCHAWNPFASLQPW